jgi:hypothetical protein
MSSVFSRAIDIAFKVLLVKTGPLVLMAKFHQKPQIQVRPDTRAGMKQLGSPNFQMEELMKNTLIYAGIVVVAALSLSPAMAQDPTQSRWYKGTQWVDPTYRFMNGATRLPSRAVPQQYRPHYNAFKYGWKGGNYIERRTRSGDRLYNYLQRRR